MRGAGQWLEALDQAGAKPARILFARLGLVALCRPLTGGELAECLEMGGERGARYALYLSCDSLRQAGEQQMLRGERISPLDITEAIGYSDVLAAAGIIARLSGAGPAQVRMLAEDEDAQTAIELGTELPGNEAPGLWPGGGGHGSEASGPVEAVKADDFFSPSDVGGWDVAAEGLSGPEGRAADTWGLNRAPAGSARAGGWPAGRYADSRADLLTGGESGLEAGDRVDGLARTLAHRLQDAAGNI